MLQSRKVFYVGICDSNFNVLNVRSYTDDVVDDRFFEAERRNDHPARFRSQVVETSQFKLNHFRAIFLKNNVSFFIAGKFDAVFVKKE